jgi:hypothetical protein
MRNEACPYRVQHYVPADFPQVGVTVHELGAEAALQHMAASLVSSIEPLRVNAVQLSHYD